MIKKVLIAMLTAILIGGCSLIKYVPIETGTTVNVKDSLVLHIKDSIRISEATYQKDLAWITDTLRITGNRSSMVAYADTLKEVLVGSLKEEEIEERYKIIYKDKVVYKDSLVTKEIPVEVEVVKTVHPKYEKYLWFWSILSILCIGLFLYKKIKI